MKGSEVDIPPAHVLDGFHDDSIMDVCWLDGTKLMTASLDHTVASWDLGDERVLQRFAGHSRGVTAVRRLDPERTTEPLFVTGGLDHSLRVWSLGRAQIVRTLNNHTREVVKVAHRPTAAGLPMIASISLDRTVRFWQPTIGRMVRFAKLPAEPSDLVWSADGTRIAVLTRDARVFWVDPATVAMEETAKAFAGIAYAMALHPDGSLIVGGSNGRLVRLK